MSVADSQASPPPAVHTPPSASDSMLADRDPRASAADSQDHDTDSSSTSSASNASPHKSEDETQGPRIYPRMTLRHECAHHDAGASESGINRIRLVHWPSKTIRVFCGLDCAELVTNNWRIIAISHVWGRTRDHHIEGVPWPVPIADEKSLEAAFEGCQPQDLHWLDVLSIDQQSGDELVYSTKEMSVVFARADAVRLWLPEAASPWPLLGTLEPSKDALVAMIRRLAGDTDLDPLVFPELRIDSTDPQPLSLKTILTWLCDCRNDMWFRRIWTTQEMVLAKSFVFRGRAFDFSRIDEWYKLFRSKDLVPKEILPRLPLAELEALTWNPTKSYIGSDHVAFDYSQALREAVQSSSTGCSLMVVQHTIQLRECSFIRDKVLTMAPLLKCDLAFPEFAFDDKSAELAERLWHYAVVRKMANGDISIVYEINPGHTPRDRGLWHPALFLGKFGQGRCNSCVYFRRYMFPRIEIAGNKTNSLLSLFQPRYRHSPRSPASPSTEVPGPGFARGVAFMETHSGSPITLPDPEGGYFVDDLPYDFWHPTQPFTPEDPHPALLRNVHLIECEAVWKQRNCSTPYDEEYDKLLGIAEGRRDRARKMLARLNPRDGALSSTIITSSHCSGMARVGCMLAPFWMHPSFAPGPDQELPGEAWRTLSIMVVVPALPKFRDGRMRCWVVGGHGSRVPNSRINDYPGPYGAVWIDWYMLHKDLGLKTRVPIDLPIP
ncbi:hypothetical protein HDU96_007990 [Phlyctochytrium bullatum]|nr:hypothetical protein HDU96_007990 [Phlyctochytrium bullatum]